MELYVGREGRVSRSRGRIAAVSTTVGLVALGLIWSAAPVRVAGAPVPAPVMTGYVPLAADATQKTMTNANPAADTDLDFSVGITNAGPGAVMTYDHWEDGFEADLTNPVQSTTEVWGDADTLNGDAQVYCGAPCAGDLLPAGAVFVLRNIVPTPRDTTVLWDGGDRVASTRGFVITAGAFSTPLGSVLSASASAYDTSRWGTDYWIPVGENMSPPAGASDAFSTASLQIMGAEPATTVDVDLDNDGVADLTQTIGQGEVMFVDGGVLRGTHVRSSKPVQVHLGAGDAGATYELRWFTLFSTDLLSSDYLNPVGSYVDTQRTITYLFNPGASDLTVTPTCPSCSGTVSVPAGGGASFPSPLGEAVRFTAAGAFVAIGAAGAQSGAAPGGGSDNSSSFDWGFGLVPSGLLTTKVLLGWAPGNSTNPPSSAPVGNYDDDPVWISALVDTTAYVDFDGDPTTGTFGGSCDGSYDTTVTMTALASVRIFDSSDGDMTGASIFTCDGTKLAGAWGEDAEHAPTGNPGFDAGYALIPSTAMVADKAVALFTDVNSDGRVGPGDELQYDVAIADAGNTAFTNIFVTDALPAGTSYIAGSTLFDDGTTITPLADDVVPPAGTVYPLDEGGAPIPAIAPGQTVHLRYRLRISDPFPAGVSVVNGVVISADEADGGDTVGLTLVAADLSVTSTVTNPPTYVGDQAMFRITVSNAGPDQANSIDVTALLPAGLTFVNASTSQGSYTSGTGRWDVGTLSASGSATLDITVTVDRVLPSTLTAEVTHTDAADPDSTPANAVPGEDDIADASVSAAPMADVSLTKTLSAGPDSAGNAAFLLTVANDGPSTATGLVVTEQPPAGSEFMIAGPVTGAVIDGTFDGTSGQWTIPDLASGGTAAILVVYRMSAAGSNAAQVTALTEYDPDSTPGTGVLDAGHPPSQDDEALVPVPPLADIELTLDVTDPPTYIGDTATFEIRVSNNGPFAADGVEVTGVLPSALVFQSGEPSVGAYDATTGVWTVGSLAVGETQTLVIHVRVAHGGPLVFDAQVTAQSTTDVDSTPNNGQAGEDDQGHASLELAGVNIGDTVWNDLDRDGVVDPGEPGLAGVTVTATWAGPNTTFGDGDDVTWSTTTDESGRWSLTGLPAGNVRVAVDPTTLPSTGLEPTFDLDGSSTPSECDLTLAIGEDRDDVDFAYADTIRETATTFPNRMVFTGGDPGPLLAAAVAVVGVGLALARASRTRRPTPSGAKRR